VNYSPQQPSQIMSDEESKKTLRMSKEIIDRIRWDKNFDTEQLIIGYVDRFVGTLECNLEVYDEGEIPQHRIIYLKYSNEIIWDRKNKIDKISFSEDPSSFLEKETPMVSNVEKNTSKSHKKKQPKPSEIEKDFEDDWSSDDEEELKALQNKY
jgi:uncharacterized protein (UPF0248 family)